MRKKVAISVFLLLPFAYLLYSVQNTNDPIKYIYTYTGTTAIILLIVSLCIMPLRKIFNFLKYRRMIGLFVFFYAFLHFLNFVILDAELDPAFIIKETLDKPFIYLGMISFLILIFMSITSAKKLFTKFNKWHKLVYLVLVLVAIHASMAQKILSGTEYFYILMVFFLIGYRVLVSLLKRVKKFKEKKI